MAIQITGYDGEPADVSPQLNKVANEQLSATQQMNNTLINSVNTNSEQQRSLILNSIQQAGERGRTEAEQAAYRGGQLAGFLSGAVGGVLENRTKQVSNKQNADVKEQQRLLGQQNLVNRIKKSKAEDLQQRGDTEYTQLSGQLRNMQADWTANDKWRKLHPLQFRDDGLDIINRASFINNEQRRNLLNILFDDTDKALGEQYNLQQEYGKRQAQEYRNFVAEQKTSTVNNILGSISAYSDPTPQLKLLNSEIQAVLDDDKSGLTLADRLYVGTTMLKIASSKIDSRNVAYSAIQDKLRRYEDYMREALPLLGNPTPENRVLNEALQEKYGIRLESNYFDPDLNRKRIEDALASQTKIDEYRKQQIIDSNRAQILSSESIGTLALQMYENPGLLDFYKKNPQYQRAGTDYAMKIAESLDTLQADKIKLSQQRASLVVTKERLKLQGISYLISDQKAAKELLARYRVAEGIDLPTSDVGLSPEQKAVYNQAISSIEAAINSEIAGLDLQINTIGNQLNPLGLNKTPDQLRKELPGRVKRLTEEIQAYDQITQSSVNAQQQRQLGIINPTGNQPQRATSDYTFKGDRGQLMLKPPSTNALKVMPVGVPNKKTGNPQRPKVILPVPATAAGISIGSRDYSEGRPTHVHAGEDISAPMGTDIVSYVGGIVVQSTRQLDRNGVPAGYGRYVTIKGDDGMYHRFAHNSVNSVSVGRRVEAGDVIGKVGSDGRSSGAHIHWEIRKTDGFGSNGTIDPLEYMSGLSVTSSVAPAPAGNKSGWGYDLNNPSPSRIPSGATLLPDGLYLLNGKVGQLQNSEVREGKDVYTPTAPLKTGFESSKATGVDTSDTETHGYSYLANNPTFMTKLNTISRNLGIPGQWLADIIAFETGNYEKANNWSHSATGVVGLIGFTPATARSLGTSTAELIKMPPEKQLDYVYKYLSDPQLKPHLSKGLEYTAAAIFGGSPLLNNLIKNRSAALKKGDGYINLDGYLKKLGRDVGRRYNIKQSSTRFDSLLAAIHTAPTEGCLVCNQLISSDSFLAHESQYEV